MESFHIKYDRTYIFDDYCPKEERINVITHFPGVLLGLVGLVYLLLKPMGLSEQVSYFVYEISHS